MYFHKCKMEHWETCEDVDCDGRCCIVPDGRGYYTSEYSDYCKEHDVWDTRGTIWTDVICDQSCELVRLIEAKPEIFGKKITKWILWSFVLHKI